MKTTLKLQRALTALLITGFSIFALAPAQEILTGNWTFPNPEVAE